MPWGDRFTTGSITLKIDLVVAARPPIFSGLFVAQMCYLPWTTILYIAFDYHERHSEGGKYHKFLSGICTFHMNCYFMLSEIWILRLKHTILLNFHKTNNISPTQLIWCLLPVYTLQILYDSFSWTLDGFSVTEGLATCNKAPPTPNDNFTKMAIQPKQVWNCIVSFRFAFKDTW